MVGMPLAGILASGQNMAAPTPPCGYPGLGTEYGCTNPASRPSCGRGMAV